MATAFKYSKLAAPAVICAGESVINRGVRPRRRRRMRLGAAPGNNNHQRRRVDGALARARPWPRGESIVCCRPLVMRKHRLNISREADITNNNENSFCGVKTPVPAGGTSQALPSRTLERAARKKPENSCRHLHRRWLAGWLTCSIISA